MYKSPEKLREEFDQVALRVEQSPDRFRIIKTDPLKNYLFSRVPTSSNAALDIGCGLGSFTTRLAERFDEVVALDLSPEMMRLARKRNSEFLNIEFVVADVNTWDFPTEKFDCVVSITTLHHMPLEPVLLKMINTLKPGGILLIGDFYDRAGVEKYVNAFYTKISRLRRKFRRSRQRKNRRVSRGGFGHDPNEEYLQIKDVRKICLSLLPGAELMKHTSYHSRFYSIVWKKPERVS